MNAVEDGLADKFFRGDNLLGILLPLETSIDGIPSRITISEKSLRSRATATSAVTWLRMPLLCDRTVRSPEMFCSYRATATNCAATMPTRPRRVRSFVFLSLCSFQWLRKKSQPAFPRPFLARHEKQEPSAPYSRVPMHVGKSAIRLPLATRN